MRLRCRLLAPLSPDQVTWIDDALVQVGDDGQLVAVGPWDGGACDEDLRPGVLTPGFVDVHLHCPQTRIIGAASGPLLQWLQTSTFPEETRCADPRHAAAVAQAFAAALAAAGTTLCLAYASVHTAAAQAMLNALDSRGLRAIGGPVLMDQGGPDALMVSADRALAELADLADHWAAHDRIDVAVIPRFALSCSARMMAGAGRLARDRGLWVSTHISENLEEIRATTDLFDATDYLAVYEAADLVHDRSIYAHAIHLSDSEWDRLAAAGAVIAHCPDSNDFLGSGGMPLHQVDQRGLRFGLGTDVAAGRTFRIPRVASSAHDNALRQGNRQRPARWLWQATRGGALALGQHQLGLLQPGMAADMVCHDLPAWVEDADSALGWLLFHHDAPAPRRTWVGGQLVWDRDAHQRAGGVFPWDGSAQ